MSHPHTQNSIYNFIVMKEDNIYTNTFKENITSGNILDTGKASTVVP